MNASAEYNRTAHECRDALARIAAALDAHADAQTAQPEWWSFVGDARKTRIDLLQIAAFLGDREAREILLAAGVES